MKPNTHINRNKFAALHSDSGDSSDEIHPSENTKTVTKITQANKLNAAAAIRTDMAHSEILFEKDLAPVKKVKSPVVKPTTTHEGTGSVNKSEQHGNVAAHPKKNVEDNQAGTEDLGPNSFKRGNKAAYTKRRTVRDDRLSKKGYGPNMKKEGGGKYNWGSDDNEQSTVHVVVSPRDENGVAKQGEHSEVTKENDDSQKAKTVETIDLETYKMQLEMKHADLPEFENKKSASVVTTESQLEAEGYKKYVKNALIAETETTERVVREKENNSKKSIPKDMIAGFYPDYSSQMALSSRGRGRRGGRARRGAERGGHNVQEPRVNRERDAPDLLDLRAFPALC